MICGAAAGGADHLGLAGHGGLEQHSAALAVVGDGASPQYGEDLVTVAQRVGQALEQDRPHSLAADEAVTGGVGELAASVGREHAALGVGDGVGR